MTPEENRKLLASILDVDIEYALKLGYPEVAGMLCTIQGAMASGDVRRLAGIMCDFSAQMLAELCALDDLENRTAVNDNITVLN